ncbi:MAG: hypothetical protein L0241_08515 [Planctomycetia bacterium]|nr:hypothetical protein [Planctomycetia bacterium]
MNDANQNSPNNPAQFPNFSAKYPVNAPASSEPPAPPATGGLKSAFKIAIPLVVLVGIVFGITFFTQYTPPEKEEEQTTTATGQPLVFFSSVRVWDPPNLEGEFRNFPLLAPSADPDKSNNPFRFNVQDRIFQGIYEPDPNKNRTAQFWFQNRHPNPVTMQLKRVSCQACSGGQVAAIPPDVTRQILQQAAVGTLPIGAITGLPVGMVEPAAQLGKLEWTYHKFETNPDATYKVPPADPNADKWSAQWGILELQFAVFKEGQKDPLKSEFAMLVEGTEITGMTEFVIHFHGANPFEVTDPIIDAGEIGDLTGDQNYSLIVFSSTRGPNSEFGDFSEPSAVITNPDGTRDQSKFIEVTKIERVADTELTELGQKLLEVGRLPRVQAAYRVTITVRAKVGEARLDIGKLTRTITFTSGNGRQDVALTAKVRGAVWLENDERTQIDLRSFSGAEGTTRVVTLVTRTTGMELAVVGDECYPKSFQYRLEKLPDRGGQGYYRLHLTVPPRRQFGAISNGVVVLEVKGKNPQRMRIPITGNGELRRN